MTLWILGFDTGCSHKVGMRFNVTFFTPQCVKKRICRWTRWTRKTRMDLLITSKLNSCCSPLPLSAPHKDGTWFHLLRSGVFQLSKHFHLLSLVSDGCSCGARCSRSAAHTLVCVCVCAVSVVLSCSCSTCSVSDVLCTLSRSR